MKKKKTLFNFSNTQLDVVRVVEMKINNEDFWVNDERLVGPLILNFFLFI